MPSFKKHTSFNMLFAYPLLLFALYYFFHPSFEHLGSFTASFLYATLFMSPDMDYARKIKWHSLRGLLTFPFRSYSRFFRHRGLSHNIFFGSLTRIFWLLGFIAIISYIFDFLFFTKESFLTFCKNEKMLFLFAFLGIFFADLFHVFLDKIKKN